MVHPVESYFPVFSPKGMHPKAQDRRAAAHPGSPANTLVEFLSPKGMYRTEPPMPQSLVKYGLEWEEWYVWDCGDATPSE